MFTSGALAALTMALLFPDRAHAVIPPAVRYIHVHTSTYVLYATDVL